MDNSLATMILAMLGVYSAILIIWYVLIVIAYWKVFSKAGEAGWKSLIPFYNVYTEFKICWKNQNMFWIYLACVIASAVLGQISGFVAILGSVAGICALVVTVLLNIRMAKAFGRGTGFAVGLLFLTPIFMMILGFGSSQYLGPQD